MFKGAVFTSDLWLKLTGIYNKKKKVVHNNPKSPNLIKPRPDYIPTLVNFLRHLASTKAWTVIGISRNPIEGFFIELFLIFRLFSFWWNHKVLFFYRKINWNVTELVSEF